jgi:histone acetyltransferase (RNA polymerase elongator complex component)
LWGGRFFATFSTVPRSISEDELMMMDKFGVDFVEVPSQLFSSQQSGFGKLRKHFRG